MKNYKLRNKRVLIISVAAGGGHIVSADNLFKTASEKFHNIEIECIDFFQYIFPLLKVLYGSFYLILIKYFPCFYGLIYNSTDKEKYSQPAKLFNSLRLEIQYFFSSKLRRKILEFKPDYIVFTHPIPAEFFNKFNCADNFKSKYAVVITDFYAHWLWYQKNIDFFFVANDELKETLINRGFDKSKIFLTGIPVDDSFNHVYDNVKILRSLGFSPEISTLLLMSGAHGVGRLDNIIGYLFDEISIKFQIIVLTGNSKVLYNKVKKIELVHPDRIKVFRYTNEVYKYMASSDVIITKAGGLTISECLCYSLPVITLNPIPGQEWKNIEYLVKHNAGLKVFDLESLKECVTNLLTNRHVLKRMQNNAGMLAKPDASNQILKVIDED
ncbi:MAG TPA: glycosyltransferase [Victivallales bacterium]|nr:glycosyltransferase [Victivallales bacterium]